MVYKLSNIDRTFLTSTLNDFTKINIYLENLYLRWYSKTTKMTSMIENGKTFCHQNIKCSVQEKTVVWIRPKKGQKVQSQGSPVPKIRVRHGIIYNHRPEASQELMNGGLSIPILSLVTGY